MKKVKIIKCFIPVEGCIKKEEEKLEEFINNHNIISWAQSGDSGCLTYTFIYEEKDD